MSPPTVTPVTRNLCPLSCHATYTGIRHNRCGRRVYHTRPPVIEERSTDRVMGGGPERGNEEGQMRSFSNCAAVIVCLGLLLGVRGATAAPAFASSFGRKGSGATPSSSPTYNGGVVLSHAQVVVVFWGPNVYSQVVSLMPTFISAMTDNEYLDWLDEYYADTPKVDPIGRGSWGGTYTITPQNHNQQLTDTAVANELGYQISHSHLPIPNSNSIYMVYFPPNYSISTPANICGNSCTTGGFCGCHESTTQVINTGTGATATFAYGIIPDLSSGPCSMSNNCAPGTPIQIAETVTTHEIAETITDPYGNGWSPEIGDPCEGQQTTITNYNGLTFTAQYLWSNSSNGCVAVKPKCQNVSQTFGLSPSTSGFAPTEVVSWWSANSCNTSPVGNVSECQNMSDMYGMSPTSSGYAPSSVVTFFGGLRCGTSPAISESLCQRASDTYGIAAGVTWGAAPSYIRTFWTSNACNTAPHGLYSCQKAADLYGIVANSTWGFASLQDVQGVWNSKGCQAVSTATTAKLCQNISDLYGTAASVTWGAATAEAQNWWIQHGCGTSPICQNVSDLVGISPGVTAMANWAQSQWYQNAGCTTEPQYIVDVCQVTADLFGAAAFPGFHDFQFLPNVGGWNSQTWWSNNCLSGNYHPRSDALRQYTPGP